MCGSTSPDLLDTVARRSSVVELLRREPADKRDLADALDVSRTTVDRAIDSLEETGCIEKTGNTWAVTLLGHLAYREYDRLRTRYTAFTAAAPLLKYLPPDAELDYRLLVDANLVRAEPPTPHAPTTPLEERLNDSTRIEALVSILLPSYVSLFHQQSTDHTTDLDLLLATSLIDPLQKRYPDELAAIQSADASTVWRLQQVPSFDIVVIDTETVWVAVYDADGGLKGSITNNTESALAWATEVIDSYRHHAKSAPSFNDLSS